MPLDAQQEVVVRAPLHPTLVVAGAGTGKTHTLMHRVIHWTQNGVDPQRTLLITFTQRAAREMRHRAAELNPHQELPWIGTFHGIAARVLRMYASSIGFGSDFRVMSRYEAERVLADVLQSLGGPAAQLDSRKLLRAQSLSVNADRPLIECIQRDLHGTSIQPEFLEEIMVEFLVTKLQRNLMDYDDLLLYWSQLLSGDSADRTSIQSLFDAVFVDEYQDVNPLQVELIDALVEEHGHLTVVGDDRQSIYGFRGSDVGAILGFEHRYPDAQVLSLENNYRSRSDIIDLASLSIQKNVHQRDTILKAMRPQGHSPVYRSVPNAHAQGVYVRDRIKDLLHHGVPPEEIAVLYRTHRESQSIEMALSDAQIPYRIRSGQRLFERPHVRPFIQFLSLFSDDADRRGIAEALELFEGIGPATSGRVADRLSTTDWIHWSAPDLLSDLALNSARRGSVNTLWKTLRQLSLWASESVPQLVRGALEMVIGPWLERQFPEDASSRYSDCAYIASTAQGHVELSHFLGTLVLEDAPEEMSGVTLSTVHRSKGLEWAAVFVVGLFDGGFPLGMTLNVAHELEEERRLFYVALTRSKDWLTLVHPWESQSGSIQMPSRFLTEILNEASHILTVESQEPEVL